MPTPIKLVVCKTFGDLVAAIELMGIDASYDTKLITGDYDFSTDGVEIQTVQHGDNVVRVNVKILGT